MGRRCQRFLEVWIKAGNTLPIRNIPVIRRCTVSNDPVRASVLAHAPPAPPCSCWLVKAFLTPRFVCVGEIQRVSNAATIGEVGNEEHSPRKIGSAARNPGVVSVRPLRYRDEPGGSPARGGGEGRTGEGRVPVSPWVSRPLLSKFRSQAYQTPPIVQRR